MEENKTEIDTWISFDAAFLAYGRTETVASGEFAQALRQFSSTKELNGQNAVLERIGRASNISVEAAALDTPMSLDHREPLRTSIAWKAHSPLPIIHDGWSPPHCDDATHNASQRIDRS
jgi:hypothetical protein